MICNVYIAAALIDIFKKLYEQNCPIEKIRLVDEYNADDKMSMRDNRVRPCRAHTKSPVKISRGLTIHMVPMIGVEPIRCCQRQILSQKPVISCCSL